jgi:hypothetical protein
VNVIVDDYIHLMEGQGCNPGLSKAYKAVQSSQENCEKAESMDAQLIGKFKSSVEALEEKLEKYLEVSSHAHLFIDGVSISFSLRLTPMSARRSPSPSPSQ